jgi:hypothetical protein
MISVFLREFQIVVYHTLLKVADSCAHLNVYVFEIVVAKGEKGTKLK